MLSIKRLYEVEGIRFLFTHTQLEKASRAFNLKHSTFVLVIGHKRLNGLSSICLFCVLFRFKWTKDFFID